MSALRDYQRDAVEATKEWLRTSSEPCLIEAPTGAGKSHIIAALAGWLHEISQGKRVLCLAPAKELTLQNHSKMIATGTPASIFSASAGAKSTRHKIVYGTPGTVSRSISRFTRGDFCAVVLDEAHTIAPTVLAIIDEMRQANPNLRVVGLSATPFKLGRGYIYKIAPDGRVNDEDVSRDPYFLKLTYSIDARYLIEQGFLTPPIIGAINTTAYDTSGLVMRPNGKFDAASVDAAFVGHGRKSSAIVGDIVAQARDRKGVVIFAATIQHAHEILASLPPSLSAVVTGETENRAAILARFERQELKYLVNVSVLTTGWDCPHVDLVAFMRRTESVGLLQQCAGRGLRLSPGKKDCLLLDFAGNFEKHTPDGDLFKPIIRAKGAPGPGVPVDVECPDCGYTNEFGLQPDYAEYPRDKHGYALDVFGAQILGEHGPISTHYGRRCLGIVPIGKGKMDRCGYRWSGKPCPQCDEPNDIAARYCYICKTEIVDPSDALIGEFRALRRDPTQIQTDRIVSVKEVAGMSRAGNPTVRLDFVTEYRQFSCWLSPNSTAPRAIADCRRWDETGGAPETVTYAKEPDTAFFRIYAFNREPDELPQELASRPEVVKLKKNESETPVCRQCGNSMSKYSSGVCRDCYTSAHPAKVKTCGICGEPTDHRADNHRACLDARKAARNAA